jgi:hypothetical protein
LKARSDVLAAISLAVANGSPGRGTLAGGPSLRAVLAVACLETGDARCAAEQALRGALRGDQRSADLLARDVIFAELTEDERALAAAARGR